MCLIVNLATGSPLGWFYMVLAGLAIVASLDRGPPHGAGEQALLDLLCFTMSLLFTLAVACFYSHGNWFYLAASAFLFASALIGLPFALRAEPVRAFIGGFNRWIIVGAVDLILFANMMNMITLYSKSIFTTISMGALCIGGAWLLYSAIKSDKSEE